MDKKTVLIISKHRADFGKLTSTLSRAQPERFDPVTHFDPVTIDTRDQPVAAALAMDYQITLGGGRPWPGRN